MNPFFLFWVTWLLVGIGVEVYAIRKSNRTGKGIERIDTLSRFTQWLVRAHQGDIIMTPAHIAFLVGWGLLAVWFPIHILAFSGAL